LPPLKLRPLVHLPCFIGRRLQPEEVEELLLVERAALVLVDLVEERVDLVRVRVRVRIRVRVRVRLRLRVRLRVS